MKLRTRRLDLVAGTVEILRAEGAGPGALGRALGADVPPDWPPPLYDDEARAFMLRFLESTPDGEGYGPWYLLLRETEGAAPTVIGTAGLKGLPAPDGTVEVGYSVLGRHQRAGYATEAVAALVDWAFARPGVRCVTAETFPALLPSIRVLEKNGFRFTGPGSEEGAVRFERPRHPAL